MPVVAGCLVFIFTLIRLRKISMRKDQYLKLPVDKCKRKMIGSDRGEILHLVDFFKHWKKSFILKACSVLMTVIYAK